MDDLSEKEQIELIREWWKENGTYVIAGIVLGVGGIVGFNLWKGGQLETRISASTQYEALTTEVAENRVEPAEAIADALLADFGDTIYADQARLAMARLYMDQGRDQDAADELQALIDAGNSDEVKMVARLRLAKVHLYQGKPESVLELLEGYEGSGFAPRYNEAIGDAHAALGNYAEAEAAYLEAMSDPSAQQLIDPALVQMKLVDLPEISADVPVTPQDAMSEPAADELPPAAEEQEEQGE